MGDVDDEEENPYRTLIEVWILNEMMFHWLEMGQVAKDVFDQFFFRTVMSRCVYRSIEIGNGDFKATIHSILEDYPPSVAREFFGNLGVIKKTLKVDYRDDWTLELDINDAIATLQKDDLIEIVHFCWRHKLTDIGVPDWFEGAHEHSDQV